MKRPSGGIWRVNLDPFKMSALEISYRDIEELMAIRGIKVDHATIQRWVFKFTPLLEKEFNKRKKVVISKLLLSAYQPE